jgi:formamidopyrimidine-DNA glycosylase
MLELPEALVVAQQINQTIGSKRITNVTAAQSPHKFAWYFGDPEKYQELLSGKVIGKAAACGGQVEIEAEDSVILMGDGVNIRFHGTNEPHPKKHQLLIEFDDYSALSGSVQMYGGLWCFPKGKNENPYYLISKQKPSPLSDVFDKAYFEGLFDVKSMKLSAKAFLATEQRIPGLGNGVLQDILYNAKIHPKRKMDTLSDLQLETLFNSIKFTLREMTINGGRDTEKDLYGCAGGYKTLLSKNTVDTPCPLCGTLIKKEAYMGGSIYYCAGCQHKEG